jgi:hypothetical protein
MFEPTIVVTCHCAECPERQEIAIPFYNAEVFERSLLECVPGRWTKMANGHFECPRHRRGADGVLSFPVVPSHPADADTPSRRSWR